MEKGLGCGAAAPTTLVGCTGVQSDRLQTRGTAAPHAVVIQGLARASICALSSGKHERHKATHKGHKAGGTPGRQAPVDNTYLVVKRATEEIARQVALEQKHHSPFVGSCCLPFRLAAAYFSHPCQPTSARLPCRRHPSRTCCGGIPRHLGAAWCDGNVPACSPPKIQPDRTISRQPVATRNLHAAGQESSARHGACMHACEARVMPATTHADCGRWPPACTQSLTAAVGDVCPPTPTPIGVLLPTSGTPGSSRACASRTCPQPHPWHVGGTQVILLLLLSLSLTLSLAPFPPPTFYLYLTF